MDILFAKITEDGKSAYVSKFQKDGYKPLDENTCPTKIPDGKKVICVYSETETNVVREWKIVDQTTLEHIESLEMKQTPRLVGEATLYAISGEEKYKESADRLAGIRSQVDELRAQLGSGDK